MIVAWILFIVFVFYIIIGYKVMQQTNHPLNWKNYNYRSDAHYVAIMVIWVPMTIVSYFRK